MFLLLLNECIIIVWIYRNRMLNIFYISDKIGGDRKVIENIYYCYVYISSDVIL